MDGCNRGNRAGRTVTESVFAAHDSSDGAFGYQATAGQTRWAVRAQQKRELAKDITWLTHEPIEFLLRRGDHSDREEEHYRRMLDPENIRRMAKAGVEYGRIFFYEGFGLEYERPHMEQATQAALL